MADFPPRVLGLDWGTVRIGVAISDPFGESGMPVATLAATPEPALWRALRAIVEEKDAARIVVGLPVNMDGTHGPSAIAAMAFAERAGRELGLPVETLDERLSSVDADSRLAETGMKWWDRKGKVDQVAAALMLTEWLERRRSAARRASEVSGPGSA